MGSAKRAGILVVLLFAAVLPLRAQPLPQVMFSDFCPPHEVLIGETISVSVTFANPGTKEGFWPFVDLVLDQGGADVGSAPCDGLAFVSAQVTSTNPSVALPPEAIAIQTAGCGGGTVKHPYEKSGVTLPALPPGAQLVVLKLPFGSFEAGQPELSIAVTIKVSSFADEGHPLRIHGRGGFRLGDDEVDDPSIGVQPILDPPAVKPLTDWPFHEVIPRVVILEKKFLGEEKEAVPGPNFEEQFSITTRVAPGQTIHDFILSDANAGPAQLEFTGIESEDPVAKTTILKGAFLVEYPSISGTSDPADVVLSTFYAKDIDGCLGGTTNLVYVGNGSWQPLDPRDPKMDQVYANPGFAAVDVKALAVSKRIVAGSLAPGGSLQYRINFRMSDYEQFRDLVVEDYFSDGQEYVPGSALLTASDGTGSVIAPFAPGFITKTEPVTAKYFCPSEICGVVETGETSLAGSTHFRFAFSDALKSLPQTPFPSGTLTGGDLTGGGPAIGEVTFTVKIRDDFQFGPHSGIDEGALDKHDPVFDRAIVHGTLVGPGLVTCTDDASLCNRLPDGPLEKRIVAKNEELLSPVPAAASGTLPGFTIGDLITYRITKVIPTGDAEEVTITDWVPQPVLSIDAMAGGTLPHCGPLPPQENLACMIAPPFVPQPAVTIDPIEQSVRFDFGNLNNPLNTSVTIEIWFTLRVTADPFADGLFLTNHAEECEQSSYGGGACQNAIAQFELNEPSLRIRKGILCSGPGCPQRTRSVGTARPFVNCDACPAMKVNSTTVGSLLQAEVYADAKDHVTYAVVIENIGKGSYGAFDINFTDVLAPGSPGLIDLDTVCLKYGDGTDVPLKGSVLKLDELDFSVVHLDGYSPTSGRNLIILTYTVELFSAKDTKIGSCVRNTATLKSYSNQFNGANFVAAGFTAGTTATASACVKSQELAKSILSKSEHPNDPLAAVWIGEVVRYQLLLQVPEGAASPLVITDHLPPGFTMISPPIVNSMNGWLDWSVPSWTPGGVITFASFLNEDTDEECEYLVIEIEARVENVAVNNDKDVKPNSFSATANGNPLGKSNVVTVSIEEAVLTVTKQLFFDGGYTGYDIVVKNESLVPAFDVNLIDVVGACIGPIAFDSIKTTGVIKGLVSGPSIASTTQTLTATSMEPGSSVTIFSLTDDAKPWDCPDCAGLTNTVHVRWTSLPGTGIHPKSAVAERNGNGQGSNDDVDVASTTRCGFVCGTKYQDLGGGAKQPIAGWKVTAYPQSNSGPPVSTTTGPDGRYCLTLLKGDYLIEEESKAGWTVISPIDFQHGPGVWEVEVDENYLVDYDADFVNRPGCTVTIEGLVFDDKNQNGSREAAEAGLSWHVFAVPTSGAGSVSYLTSTSANGQYKLILPAPETYIVQAYPVDGWLRTYPKPAPEPWTIEAKCNPATVVAPVAKDKLDFGNTRLCGPCEFGTHCEPQNGILQCVPDQNPCTPGTCPFPAKRCIYVNGVKWCVP